MFLIKYIFEYVWTFEVEFHKSMAINHKSNTAPWVALSLEHSKDFTKGSNAESPHKVPEHLIRSSTTQGVPW